MAQNTQYHKLSQEQRQTLIDHLMGNDKFDLVEMYLEKCSKKELKELLDATEQDEVYDDCE